MKSKQPWKPVPIYEQYYLVHPSGAIKSLQKNNVGYIMQQRIDRAGYMTVRLTKKDKGSTRYVHRILAMAFIPNPNNKPFVNHRNGDKLDNRLQNLEWVDRKENMLHAYRMKLAHSGSKKVVDICKNRSYNSIKEAAEKNNIRYHDLKAMIRGLRTNNTCLRLKAAA